MPHIPCRPCALPPRDLIITYHYPSTVDGTMQQGPPITYAWNGTSYTSPPGAIEPPHDSILWTGGGCQYYTHGLQCSPILGVQRINSIFRLFLDSSGATPALCSINTLPSILTAGQFDCSPLLIKFYLGFGASTNEFHLTDSAPEAIPDSTETFLIRGCNSLGLSGASVVLDGVTQTTDSTGHTTFNNVPAGIPDWSVSKSGGRFTSQTGSLSNPGCANTTTTVTLAPTGSYACACPQCAEPQKRTLTLTDANGPHTLTWNATASRWRGCYLKTGQSVATDEFACTTLDGTGSVAIAYKLECPSSGAYKLTQTWSACTAGNLPVAGFCDLGEALGNDREQFGSSDTVDGTGMTLPGDCTTPIDLDFTITGGYLNGAVTVTE